MAMNLVSLPAAWDIPVALGVPGLLGQSSTAGVAASASTVLASMLDDTRIMLADAQWGIFTADNQPVLTSGRVRALDVQAFSYVCDAPQEQGAFLSYNKVRQPSQYRVEMLCDGSGPVFGAAAGGSGVLESLLAATGLVGPSADMLMRRGFLQTLESLVDDLNLYSVVTPEVTYSNVNVQSYSLRREAQHGVTLLWAGITLQEIRLDTTTSPGTAAPAGQAMQSGGAVQAAESALDTAALF
ncbi:phage baseplate protein [Acetobacter peroxydans]|jgi:hypothetical protein|uniref:phage baseplate protein n=1 Tax=Acetobacter peroxydans TaxID=104098 RepID=UPI002355B5EC|nr:hypothetical protein [Acetobacter peroxydans]MCH4143176.1 hypothetical protein [Acetobacter peroxydans]MCI1394029.1 hypothetical protein [Acetobacter peroxydans]MCI1411643.1 hypothetical protein [Acetobacter peroxydans]MCI1439305.1 hypothetical protein [Acetobacter peroxydans]MCI1566961.1 hypothetical protein [Acetobacter peroxydans]